MANVQQHAFKTVSEVSNRHMCGSLLRERCTWRTDQTSSCSLVAVPRPSRCFLPAVTGACRPRPHLRAIRAAIARARPEGQRPCVSIRRRPCRTTADASPPGTPTPATAPQSHNCCSRKCTDYITEYI